jgi:hypothetical protein
MRIEKSNIMVLGTDDIEDYGLINGREFAFTNTSKEFITFNLLDLRCMYEYNTLSYPLSNTIQCINHTAGKVEMIKFNHEVMRTIFNNHRYLKYFCDNNVNLITLGIEDGGSNYSLSVYDNNIVISKFNGINSKSTIIDTIVVNRQSLFVITIMKLLYNNNKYSCEFLNLFRQNSVAGTLTFIRKNNIVSILFQDKNNDYQEFKFSEDSLVKFIHAIESDIRRIIL